MRLMGAPAAQKGTMAPTNRSSHTPILDCVYALLMLSFALPLGYIKLGIERGCTPANAGAREDTAQVLRLGNLGTLLTCALERAPAAEYLWLGGWLVLLSTQIIACQVRSYEQRWRWIFAAAHRVMPPAVTLLSHYALGQHAVDRAAFMLMAFSIAPAAHVLNALLLPVSALGGGVSVPLDLVLFAPFFQHLGDALCPF